MLRLSFQVSDGLYFGEGPVDMLFRDPVGGPVLTKATELVKLVTALPHRGGQP